MVRFWLVGCKGGRKVEREGRLRNGQDVLAGRGGSFCIFLFCVVEVGMG